MLLENSRYCLEIIPLKWKMNSLEQVKKDNDKKTIFANSILE
jgi:hypothetical protein